MADRKQTPDILGEILGGDASATAPPPTPAPAPEPEPAPKPAPKRAPARKSTPRKTRSRAKPKPKPWEYLEVVFRNYGGYRPRVVNGEEQADWKQGPVAHEYLNELGEQGWEMAGVSSRENREMVAYLKRLK